MEACGIDVFKTARRNGFQIFRTIIYKYHVIAWSDPKRRACAYEKMPANILVHIPIDKLTGSGWTEDNILLLPSHAHTSLEMFALNDKNIFGMQGEHGHVQIFFTS